jgi:hypothetical protein
MATDAVLVPAMADPERQWEVPLIDEFLRSALQRLLHIEVEPDLTVAAAHIIAGHVRRRVRAKVAWVADVLVHVEPSTAKST